MVARRFLLSWICWASAPVASATPQPPPPTPTLVTADAPPGAARLVAAYPGRLCGANAEHLLWCDGQRMPWRTRQPPKVYEARLNSADLLDQLSQPYPAPGSPISPPPVNFDPGRMRSQPFFLKMYGADRAAVARAVVKVPWMSTHKPLRVTRLNEVDQRIKAISAELERLPLQARKVASQTSGAFVWRSIKGSKRLSAHSFAIAVDVGVPVSNYWKWSKPDAQGHYPYVNRFPLEIVEVFERHCFAWGGRWYHYDTMHFEYRPELFASCAPLPSGL
ncbi:M15 family metallopeptidase [Myxococcota bacterium]|nr:M15 family metallopeptidase [Myxococcota bacterium]MBU1897976.1 M15 family metallopeptidase [Myxococcota bacterium]